MPARPRPRDPRSSNLEEPVHRVVLSGDVDLAQQAELDLLIETFRRSRTPNVDVDLAAVDFLDSTGLGAMFTLQRIAAERGGRIRLRGPNRSVLRALELAGVAHLVVEPS